MVGTDRCPIDHDQMRWLWKHNGPVLDELRQIVEPLTEAVASRVENDLRVEDVVEFETRGAFVQRNVPFGEPYAMLPPRMFDELTDQTMIAPEIPRNARDIEALVDEYGDRRNRAPMENSRESARYDWLTTGDTYQDELVEALQSLRDRNISIDPVKWQRYKEAGKEQARRGRYDLDIITMRRAGSLKTMRGYELYAELADNHATGEFENFMIMQTATLDEGGHWRGLIPVGYLFMPVGEYGEEFAERLLRTTTYVVNATGRTVQPLARTLAETHEEAITKYTARGADERPLDVALTMMTQEGARSIMEAVALLTANKVEGYDDPERLFGEIIEQGILEQFTRSMPMGLLGPLAFSGKYFPEILRNKGDGRLELNRDVLDTLKLTKYKKAAMEIGEWTTYWSLTDEERKDVEPPVATSLICPAAMPGGALKRMSGAMLKAFKAFHFSPEQLQLESDATPTSCSASVLDTVPPISFSV